MKVQTLVLLAELESQLFHEFWCNIHLSKPTANYYPENVHNQIFKAGFVVLDHFHKDVFNICSMHRLTKQFKIYCLEAFIHNFVYIFENHKRQSFIVFVLYVIKLKYLDSTFYRCFNWYVCCSGNIFSSLILVI